MVQKLSTICRRRVRPHDAADVPVAVEHVIIIVRPLAARAGFGGAFQQEHGSGFLSGCFLTYPGHGLLFKIVKISRSDS